MKQWGFGLKYDVMEGLARLMGQNISRKNTEDISPYKYLLEKIGNKNVNVYQDDDPVFTYNNPAFNSFKEAKTAN